VAAENKFERTGGLSAWARGYSGVDANLRNSFIDNTVLEGNHVWNYNTVRAHTAWLTTLPPCALPHSLLLRRPWYCVVAERSSSTRRLPILSRRFEDS
jgi:hypothetical protein